MSTIILKLFDNCLWWFKKKNNYPEEVRKELHEHYVKIHTYEKAIKEHRREIEIIKQRYNNKN